MAGAKKISLHIGLNSANTASYPGWNHDLRSAEADAEAMRGLLQAEGFEAEPLYGPAATRDAVKGQIRATAGRVGEGDLFVVSFSGHGGRVPDLEGDEWTGEDSTWCLHDGQLIDDELHDLWADFPAGARVVVISDSCHSGTILKFNAVGEVEADARARVLPDGIVEATYEAFKSFYDGLVRSGPQRDVKAMVRQLSACRDEELAYEDASHGFFTAALLEVWDAGAFVGTYDGFHREIAKRVFGQTPQHQTLGAAADPSDQPFRL